MKKWMDIENGEAFASHTIKERHIVDKIFPRSPRGIKLRRQGRVIEIKFSAKLKGEDVSALLTFNQNEIFQMAKMIRRDRSDEQFLKAIESAGE